MGLTRDLTDRGDRLIDRLGTAPGENLIHLSAPCPQFGTFPLAGDGCLIPEPGLAREAAGLVPWRWYELKQWTRRSRRVVGRHGAKQFERPRQSDERLALPGEARGNVSAEASDRRLDGLPFVRRYRPGEALMLQPGGKVEPLGLTIIEGRGILSRFEIRPATDRTDANHPDGNVVGCPKLDIELVNARWFVESISHGRVAASPPHLEPRRFLDIEEIVDDIAVLDQVGFSLTTERSSLFGLS